MNKSSCGLKKASRTFNKRLVSDLNRIGFKQSMCDPRVLRFIMGDEVGGMVAIHVDDILYAKTNSPAKVVVEGLGNSLSTKNLGEVKSFFGCDFFATATLARLRFLKRVTSGVFSRDSIIVAPARSVLPLPTITGP